MVLHEYVAAHYDVDFLWPEEQDVVLLDEVELHDVKHVTDQWHFEPLEERSAAQLVYDAVDLLVEPLGMLVLPQDVLVVLVEVLQVVWTQDSPLSIRLVQLDDTAEALDILE